MMLENTLSEERLSTVTRPTTKHPESKDLSLKRKLEERRSMQELESIDGRLVKKLMLLMKRFCPSILRKRKLPPRKTMLLKLVPLPRLLPHQPKHLQLKQHQPRKQPRKHQLPQLKLQLKNLMRAKKNQLRAKRRSEFVIVITYLETEVSCG